MLRRNFLSRAAGLFAGLPAVRAAGFHVAAFERPRVLAAADLRDWPVRQPLLWV